MGLNEGELPAVRREGDGAADVVQELARSAARARDLIEGCLVVVLFGAHVVDGIAVGRKRDEAGLTASERALLEYVELVTKAAYKTTAEDVQKLRDAGWKEEQIAEAVYVTAMFAFFNRIADAFGIPSQEYVSTGKLTP